MNKNSTDRKAILYICTLCAFLTPITISSVNVALPSITLEFNADNIISNWIVTSYILVTALFLMPFGRIGDIYGREKIFKIGFFIFAIGGFLCSISFSSFTLICARIIHGIGSSMIWGTGVAILMSAYAEGEKGKVLGINVAAVYLGLSVGPMFGGFCSTYLHWRSIFIITGLTGLILAVISIYKLPNNLSNRLSEKFDFIGALLYCSAIVPAFIGFSNLPKISGIISVFSGLILFIIFIFYEYKIEFPILNIRIFMNNRVFVFSNIAALINYSATFAVGFLLSLYLQYIKAFNPQKAGIILTVQPVMQFLISPYAGKLSDRIEPRFIASFGMFLTAAGLFMLAFINYSTPLFYIISSLIFLGIGFGFFSAPNTNAVMNSVEKKYYGVASGTLGTMRMFGQMLSMGTVLILFAIIMGKIKISEKNYPMFLLCVQRAFLIFFILCGLGVFASLMRGRKV